MDSSQLSIALHRADKNPDWLDTLSEDDYDKLLADIALYARNDFSSFLSLCHSLELQPYGGLSLIYEALAIQADDNKDWGEFYLKEYKRLFQAAEYSETPATILEALTDIYYEDKTAEAEKKRFAIIEFLFSYLRHSNPDIRHISLYYIESMLNNLETDQQEYSYMIPMFESLLSDSNWRVRLLAHTILCDLFYKNEEDYPLSKSDQMYKNDPKQYEKALYFWETGDDDPDEEIEETPYQKKTTSTTLFFEKDNKNESFLNRWYKKLFG